MTLTLYTSEPQPKIDALITAFTTENPDIEVDVLRARTGRSRSATEAAAGEIHADVLLAADAPTFERYKQDDLLMRYLPADVFALQPEVVDPEGHYGGTRMIPTAISYHTKDGSSPPTSWKELTDSRFQGRIALPNPQVSGAAAYNTAVWKATSWLGESWLNGLAANRPMVAQSNGWVGGLVAAGIRRLPRQ